MKNIFSILFSCIALTAFAQGGNGDLPGGEVEVVATFEAQLAEVERLEVKPELPPLEDKVNSQTYNNLPTRNLEVNYPAPTIRPIAMKREKLPDAYAGYVKAGIGLPNAFMGELGYGKRFGKKFDLGINADFLSMSNSKKVDNQKFRNIGAEVDGTYYLKDGIAVEGNIGFSSDKLHYFGYNELDEFADSTFLDSDVAQRFNLFEIGAKVFNGQQTVGDFNYSAGIDLYRLSDLYATAESGFDLKLQATKYFAGEHPLDIVLRTDFTAYEDTTKQNLNNFYLEPSFTYVGEGFKIRGGVNIVSSEDEFFFFPDAEVLVNVIGSTLSAFVGADGSLQKQNFRNLTEYNPYLKSRIDLTNNKWQYYYGGVKGAVSFFEYRAEVGYKKNDNLAMYLPEFDMATKRYIQRFTPVFDTVNIVRIGGSLSAKPIKNLEVRGTVNQNIYTLQNLEKPWHLPAFEVNATLLYKALGDKVLFRGDLFIENGVPFLNADGVADNLNGLFDISLGAEYFITKNIGAFLQVNNLANNRRQRWQNYPTLGLNALVGVTARF